MFPLLFVVFDPLYPSFETGLGCYCLPTEPRVAAAELLDFSFCRVSRDF
jgi:hypothetical protein